MDNFEFDSIKEDQTFEENTDASEFDFDSIKVSNYLSEGSGFKEVCTKIPVKKPKSGTEFFRTRLGNEWSTKVKLLYVEDEGGFGEIPYVVIRELYKEVERIAPGKLKDVALYLSINQFGEIFFHIIPEPDEWGQDNEFDKQRRNAKDLAYSKWVKLLYDKRRKAYRVFENENSNAPEPDWPDEPKNMNEALKIAFEGRIIKISNHPILRKLREV